LEKLGHIFRVIHSLGSNYGQFNFHSINMCFLVCLRVSTVKLPRTHVKTELCIQSVCQHVNHWLLQWARAVFPPRIHRKTN